jgi:hypothetical protein
MNPELHRLGADLRSYLGESDPKNPLASLVLLSITTAQAGSAGIVPVGAVALIRSRKSMIALAALIPGQSLGTLGREVVFLDVAADAC